MGIKLLIADGEGMMRKGIEKYIQLHTDRFDRIFVAADGQETIDMIFRNRPDIMLLDAKIPVQGSIAVMEKVGREGVLPYTVILSDEEAFGYCQQVIGAGAKDYLLKPVRPSDILLKLNKVADELFGVEKTELEDIGGEKNRLVEQAMEYIVEHYYENITLVEVAQEVGITAGYLSTLFSQKSGKNFVDYLNELRISHACDYLKQNYFKTYEIAYKVGFRDEKYFSKVFKKVMGQSPSDYRKANREC